MTRSLSKIVVVLFVLCAGAMPALASGFEIEEQDAKGLGTAYAGRAAAAENAAAIYWNPASITNLKGGWLTFGLAVPIVMANLEDQGSTNPLGAPTNNSTEEDGGGAAVLPHVYFTHQLGKHFAAGIGVNVPFALSTEYGGTWFGRYHADKSEVMVINVHPGIAWAPVRGAAPWLDR